MNLQINCVLFVKCLKKVQNGSPPKVSFLRSMAHARDKLGQVAPRLGGLADFSVTAKK